MTADDEPISPAMNTLLELFATHMTELRFGDLDRAALTSAAEAVRTAASELAEAEAAAATARAALEAAREALLQKGQRALAYARIYAEGSPELAERLDAITLVRAGRRAEPATTGQAEAPRRRGRPPKVAAADGSGTLPLDSEAPRPTNGLAPRPQEDARGSA
jgi:multidrug efflux pump subunit AcrA (membrane-fusion protein)